MTDEIEARQRMKAKWADTCLGIVFLVCTTAVICLAITTCGGPV